MKTKELNTILLVLNSTDSLMGKYPIGNKELTLKVRELESNGIIKYDALTNKWNKRTNRILNRLS